MMKHKTSELEGALLDAAVAKAADVRLVDRYVEDGRRAVFDSGGTFRDAYTPSTSWALGGPLIERERISVYQSDRGGWSALPRGWLSDPDRKPPFVAGPTPLMAAMRAFVASKLGEEVDLG